MEGHLVHGDFHMTDYLLPFVIEHGFQRQVFRVEQSIVFGLPVVGINGLLKIAFAIKQTDPHQAHSQITGCFGMVACQHP